MKGQSWLLLALLIAVVVIIGVSMVHLGSPATVRGREHDNERTEDLRRIMYLVAGYFDDQGQLPPDLGALRRGNRWRQIPTDPSTGNEYGYRVLGDHRYELCASFAGEHHTAGEWAHGPGRQCFEMVVSEGD